jgi:DNA-binding beta-propeller fold protein YncE
MQLKRPVAVALADDGEIYVADNDRGSIFVFDAQERYSRAMGHPKLKPAGLAVSGDRLYVTDLASQTVEWYNRKTGERQGSFGTVGDEDGQFRLPLGIATDTKGDVYVVDMMRCRVQKFTPDGKFISGFGSLGDFAGAFVRPKHIAVDSDGIIYVVDAAFQNVQMFDSQYHLLMHFGASGNFPGAMNLPAGICVSDDSIDLFKDQINPGFKPKRLLVVTNQFGDMKVSLYAMGGLREGYTAKDLAASAIRVPTGMGEGAKNILQSPVPGSEELSLSGEGPNAKTNATPRPAAPADSTAAPEPASSKPK